MNTEDRKTKESHKLILSLSQRLNLRNSNKHVFIRNLSIYYMWKNIRKQYKNSKLKVIAPTWNDEFELPDGSYSISSIQDHIEYIIKKHKTLTTIPPIDVYNKRIHKRLVFKIDNGCKLELQTPETMKLFGSVKELIDQTKKKIKKQKEHQGEKKEKKHQVLK